MAKTPVTSYNPTKFSEDAEYSLQTAIEGINFLANALEGKASKQDLASINQLSAALEGKASKQDVMDLTRAVERLTDRALTSADLNPILASLDNRVSKEDFNALVSDYNRRVVDAMSAAEMVGILNLISNKISKLKAAIISQAEKLDAEDVTNLDQDYAAQAASDLSGA